LDNGRTLLRPATAGMLVSVFVFAVVIWDAVWSFERSGFVLSVLFFSIVGFFFGAGAFFLWTKRGNPPDPVQGISGTVLVCALFFSWWGGPGEAFERAGWASYYEPDVVGPGTVFLMVSFFTFLFGAAVWLDSR